MDVGRPVLIIDDEYHVTRSLQYLLENNDLKCITENSPERVADLMEKNPIGIVIMDINMPAMDGFQLCRQIRGNKKYDDVVILFLSGRSHQEDMDKAYEAGANGYFVKPFSPLELRDIIKNIYGVE